jgi:hypothetical protein
MISGPCGHVHHKRATRAAAVGKQLRGLGTEVTQQLALAGPVSRAAIPNVVTKPQDNIDPVLATVGSQVLMPQLRLDGIDQFSRPVLPARNLQLNPDPQWRLASLWHVDPKATSAPPYELLHTVNSRNPETRQGQPQQRPQDVMGIGLTPRAAAIPESDDALCTRLNCLLDLLHGLALWAHWPPASLVGS